jgi:hypothetical protein
VGNSFFNNNIRFLQSGLTIVSRWPIVTEGHHVFTGSTYHMEQFMAKAVQYAKIIIENTFIVHVLNTHTQAWTNEKANNVRATQFEQMNTFIQQLNILPSEPLILCGDYNIDFYEHSTIIDNMMNRVHMQLHLPPQPQFSFDPTVNKLVGTDDASEYTTRAFTNGCYDEYLQTSVCVCCPRQLIDGIATSDRHLRPVSVHTKVVPNLSNREFSIYVNVSSERSMRNVSDHFLVTSEFAFPIKIECCAVLYPHKIQTICFQKQYSPAWICLEVLLFLMVYPCLLFSIYQLFKIRQRKKHI